VVSVNVDETLKGAARRTIEIPPIRLGHP
jgi:hypothetical protein